MAESADWIARGMGAASLVVSGLALWLNWQKNERDLAALRPHVSVDHQRLGARGWRVTVTVTNSLQTPIVWRGVHASAPKGLLIGEKGHIDGMRNLGQADTAGYWPSLLLPDGPWRMAPGESREWLGYAFVDHRYGARLEDVPVLSMMIDGITSKVGLYRRLASWIWPIPIRM